MVRAKTFVPQALPLLAGLLCLSTPAPVAHADTLLYWDFENITSAGTISTSVGTSGASGISGFASQTGGGPAENFGGSLGMVHLTRFFGTNYPYLKFTLTCPMYLQSVTFDHIHNHNPGFPTYPDYQAQLQIDTGSGFADIGSPVYLTGSNVPQFGGSVSLGVALNPGTYQIRWVPRNLAYGSDTNTEYFALNNLSLNGNAIYEWSDVLQPINADGNSIFKLGSTVPVKFRLAGCSAGITTLTASLYVAKVSDNVVGTESEADSTSAATTGNLFRYDAAGGQYIFNWGTKGLTAGTYQLRIDLGDGVPHTVLVSLR
jgi:hypothetical protein